MKIILSETQIISLLEKINSNEVTCDKCGWSWDLSDGGDDPYICHKCGHSNSEEDYVGKKVMVYYNLHKHTFSVTYKSKVVLHADYVKLKDVEFRVRTGGKEKVRNEKRKNVHAFVIGKLVDFCEHPCKDLPKESSSKIVTYDPYKYDTFVYKDTEEPVHTAKEIDMINHRNKLFVISEIKSSLNESEEVDSPPNKFTYTTIGLFQKGTTKRYYFNDPKPVDGEDIPDGMIGINGALGNFLFAKNDVGFDSKNNKLFVNKDILDSKYNGIKSNSDAEKIGITPIKIREALKKAFPSNWHEEDSIFTAGLRDVYSIGEKTNDGEETWSIMNYFDTKPEIHALLYLKYMDEKSNEEIVEWMSNLFRNDEEFTKLLVNRQWSSIENGLRLERDSVSNFLNKISKGNVVYYPHGSKMDRWSGVDVTIEGVNYQIKPLKSYEEENGVFTVNTYGMRDYTSKTKLDKIAFANSKEALVFDNKNYNVVSRNKAVFNQTPNIIN